MFDFSSLSKFFSLRKEIQKIKEEVEIKGTKVRVNGNFEIEEILLNPSLDEKTQQKILKKALNQAFAKIKQKLFQKIQKDIFQK